MIPTKKFETFIIVGNFIWMLIALIVKNKQIETTSYSKFLLHTYMMALLGICLITSLCKVDFISQQIGIFDSSKGRAIVLGFIALIYICSSSLSLLIFGIVLFFSAAAIIAMDYFIPSETTLSTHSNNPSTIKEMNVNNAPVEEKPKDIQKDNPYGVPEDF